MKDLITRPERPLAAALGYFDGVHIGHRRVLSAAAAAAAQNGWESGVFTFVFEGANTLKGAGILQTQERRRRMEELGLDYYYCPAYEQFKDFSPEEFVDEVLVQKMHAAAVFTGDNFTFGKGGKGNVALLHRLCEERGISHTVVDMQSEDGTLVSSTRIRQLLEQGETEHANRLLGEPYAVTLPVENGQKIGGGKLGFPTINQVYPTGMLMPRQGVYISAAWVNGVRYAAATGLGTRPTVGGENVTCESFLLDFSGDLYGREVRLELLSYLEPTRRYENLDQLKDCIRRAAAKARAYPAPSGTVREDEPKMAKV